MTQCTTNEVKTPNIENKSQWELVSFSKVEVNKEYKTMNWLRLKVIWLDKWLVHFNPRVIWEWYTNKRYTLENPLLFTI